MFSPINFFTSPSAANFVQNSTAQVLSEGCLKAIGRPAFTLMDKTATSEQKKYSSTKEFIYQSLSMLAYFLMIFPIRNNSYKLLKKFPQISNYNKDNNPLKAGTDEIKSVINSKSSKEFENNLSKITDKEFISKVKGAKEFVSIIASGVILAVIAPRVVNKIVHPILAKIFDDKKSEKLDETV